MQYLLTPEEHAELRSKDMLFSYDRKGEFDLLEVPSYRIELLMRPPAEDIPLMADKV